MAPEEDSISRCQEVEEMAAMTVEASEAGVATSQNDEEEDYYQVWGSSG